MAKLVIKHMDTNGNQVQDTISYIKNLLVVYNYPNWTTPTTAIEDLKTLESAARQLSGAINSGTYADSTYSLDISLNEIASD